MYRIALIMNFFIASDVFYATNPVLLSGWGLAGVSDGRWARWSGKFQQVVLEFTGGLVVCCYGDR